MKTAILVDGGFYRRMANHYVGAIPAIDRAKELALYCRKHLLQKDLYVKDDKGKRYEYSELYRVFYYDCPPTDKNVFHPLKKSSINFKKKPTYTWMTEFLDALKSKRKFALRLGFLAADEASFTLKPDILKKLFNGSKGISDVTESDFVLTLQQKGVDMKIGLDIASLAYKHLVDQIVLVSGDSDFTPAAKLARMEGIDFILDPMGHKVNDFLLEHVDGLRSYYSMLKHDLKDEDASFAS